MKINKNFFKNKTLLITGGTGSIGNALINYFIKENFSLKKIVIYSRDEWKQYEMENRFKNNKNQNIRFFLGDVREKSRLLMAMNDIDIVIHAAALKQVDKAELEPIETIKTNIYGAQNVINSALESSVKNVIALSTDKASSPINLYGATKLCSDKLFVAANNLKGKKDIKFSVVRYGNVLNSRGSVLPLFKSQIKNKYFTITHPDMTRFLITLKQSVEFILWSLTINTGGEIFVPKLSSFKILDLAKSLNPKAKIKIVGIRLGEKLHEELISFDDSVNVIELKHAYIIKNLFNFNNKLNSKLINNFIKYYGGNKIKKQFIYNSINNKYFYDVNDLKKILLNLES
jgi:UDP-N-acetylglucosamine 4,6-dehydratase (inverting)